MKHLYIIRHGQTDFNVKRIVQGRGVNSRLNEEGKQQSLAFFEAYKDHPFEVVLTSTLDRTIETVAPFIAEKGLAHHQFPELDEISWGIFEGKPSNPALHQKYDEVLSAWGRGDYHQRIEEGESAWELLERLKTWLEKLHALPHHHILICTHGAVMSILMTLLRNEPLSEMTKYRHKNTGLCKLVQQGDIFHLELQDDISHLSD